MEKNSTSVLLLFKCVFFLSLNKYQLEPGRVTGLIKWLLDYLLWLWCFLREISPAARLAYAFRCGIGALRKP